MNNNEQKPDSFVGGGDDSQFNQSGFGNSTFGGPGGSAFGSQPNSAFGAPANSKFGGNSEFGSGSFGGNTSVSQIFKEGGFGEDEKRKKALIAGVAIVGVVAVGMSAYYLFMGDDTSYENQFTVPDMAAPAVESDLESQLAADGSVGDELAGGEIADELLGEEALLIAEEEASLLDEPALPEVADEFSAAVGSAPVGQVGNVTTWDYNEELGGPTINVTPGAMIEVSRRSDFANTYVYGPAPDGVFRIPNPPPGSVYWREQGSGSLNEIQVNPPRSLGMSFSAPANLTSGESLFWSSANAAAYYRVEFAMDPGFTNLSAAVSTTGTQAVIDGLASGTYYVRVGGLNTAAGRFEYSNSASISVQ